MNATLTVCGLAADSDTVNVAVPPVPVPSVADTSSIDSDGPSSSSIVIAPEPSSIVALTAFDNSTVNSSSISSMVSPRTGTVTVLTYPPG